MSTATTRRAKKSVALLVCTLSLVVSSLGQSGDAPDAPQRTLRPSVSPGQPQSLFFMFAQYRDVGALDVIEQYLTSADYVARLVAVAHPTLLSTNGIPPNHVFQIPTSLVTVSAAAANLCRNRTPGLILYDIEHWDATPMAEQREPGSSINQCAAIINDTGCSPPIAYGIIPDGRFSGLPARECRPNFTASIYDGLGGSAGTSQIDWSKITFLGIQSQRMLDEGYPGNCHNRNSPCAIESYVNFVSAISAYAYRQNPRIICTAQVSFRWTSPPVIVAAIQAVAPYVDGVYLAFPTGGKLCTPENLKTVLAAFRPAVSARPQSSPP